MLKKGQFRLRPSNQGCRRRPFLKFSAPPDKFRLRLPGTTHRSRPHRGLPPRRPPPTRSPPTRSLTTPPLSSSFSSSYSSSSYYYSSSSSYYSLSSSFFFYSYKKNTIKVKITLGSRKNNIYNRVGVGVGAGAGQKTAPAPPKNPRYGRLWRPCMKGRLRNTELPVAADFLTIFHKKLEGRGDSIRFFLVIMFIQFSDFTWI